MKQCGCVHNVWEGLYQGEGILSELKPLISDLMLKKHNQKPLKMILNKYSEERKTLYNSINVCRCKGNKYIEGLTAERK